LILFFFKKINLPTPQLFSNSATSTEVAFFKYAYAAKFLFLFFSIFQFFKLIDEENYFL